MNLRLLLVALAATLTLTACAGDKDTVEEDTADTATATEAGSPPRIESATTRPPVPPPMPPPVTLPVSIRDKAGEVALTISADELSMTLSQTAFERLQSGVATRGLGDRLKEELLSAVEEALVEELKDALNQGQEDQLYSIAYPLADVTSMRWDEERLWIDVARAKPVSFDDVRSATGAPVLAQFYRNDAMKLIAAWQQTQM